MGKKRNSIRNSIEVSAMYHPNKYKDHNESLKRFVDTFNECSKTVGGRIIMEIRENENFRDDGIIKDRNTGKEIIFDWEKRHTYYLNCGFPFETFGQFERKIIKKEIQLSIQCSKNEDCFCIAWHGDFKKESVERIPTIKENGTYESKGKRYTRMFKEIKYSEIGIFYKILCKAFDKKMFNHNSFNIVGNNNDE